MPLTLTIADSGTGGGFIATVSGSTPGSLNTLYQQKVDGSITVSGDGFTSAGTRLSDGVITGTISPRYYWWYVVNNNAGQITVSNFVYQNLVPTVAGSPDPVHQRLIDYTVARITALNLQDISSVSYKKITYLQGNVDLDFESPTSGVVVLTSFEQGAEYIGNMSQKDDVRFPIWCLFITRQPKTDATSPRDLMWQQRVARAFLHQQVGAAVPENVITDIPRASTFEAAQLDSALSRYQFSSLVISYLCRVIRGFGA